uniref:Cytochrome c oxidase subunit 3 n=1 Tax=Nesidiocoris poppiusi TaxID=3059073 RepID=A0AAT9VVU7_9HEMI|nr:cytochrome c oxidase subunit III [Nesidiocoris poppiusi]WKW91652.1 cytochrome c oxidase subunit 3 [Nesidiocoris poppiusi]
MSKHNHPFHLVDYSPWPLTGSIGALTFVSGMVLFLHKNNSTMILMGTIIILLTMFQWWRDIVREGTFQGKHTMKVVQGLKLGMILFIISEVLFFTSFFWAFFHSSLSPTVEIGGVWPPKGIISFDPKQIPLLNTMILLCSGISITWAHHSMMSMEYKNTITALVITVTLGIYFSVLQGYEYFEAMFNISDSIYGSCFFMATGFHGLHVLIGTIFIAICLIRQTLYHFSSDHHFGFEASAWYWHFVDVVWLFLYITIYWWGS